MYFIAYIVFSLVCSVIALYQIREEFDGIPLFMFVLSILFGPMALIANWITFAEPVMLFKKNETKSKNNS